MIIYLIENKINGKKYVGLTSKSLEHRWSGHVSDAKRGSTRPLQKAIRKYGIEAFDKKQIASTNYHPFLLLLEQTLIKHLRSQSPSGYNLTAGGEGLFGLVFSPTHRQNLSKAQLGNTKSKGAIRSAEYKIKMGESLKGRRFSKETIERMRQSQLGNVNALGYKHSEETRTEMSTTRRGRKHSEETRLKMRVAALAREARIGSVGVGR